MKSILMSIRPEWARKIFNGEKTIEVRKTRPLIDMPFKVLVYCTKKRMTRVPSMYAYLHKNEPGACAEYGTIETWGKIGDVIVNPHLASRHVSFGMHGKVIGWFVCDEVYDFFPWGAGVGCTNKNENLLPPEIVVKETCLTEQQIIDYLEKGKRTFEGYGWHITEPKLFEKPKELSEFYTLGNCEKYDFCNQCKNFHRGQGWLDGSYFDEDSCLDNTRIPVTRAPQSWQYVEEV